MTNDSLSYTTEELMATVIAREISNGENVAVGTFSPIPASASLLAKFSHAPESGVFILGCKKWWPFSEGSMEFFNCAQRGLFDYFFLSGAQIDRIGNVNLHTIGSYSQPKVRLPGGAGSAMLYYMVKKVILFRTDHSAKTFVEKVDFVTSTSSSPATVYRPGGLHSVITPLAVMVPNQNTHCLELLSVHPGYSPGDVRSNTGFELPYFKGIAAVTEPPSRDELTILRGPVREAVSEIYPHFANNAFGKSNTT